MRLHLLCSKGHRVCSVIWRRLLLVGLIFLLSQCSSDGDSGSLSPQPTQIPALERQAIVNMLDLYRTAVVQEDIDRLQELLQLSPDTVTAQQQRQVSPGTPSQCSAGTFPDVEAFRACMTTTFQTQTVVALATQHEEMESAAGTLQVSFQEIESVEDPRTLEQRTTVFRTTFTVHRDELQGVVTMRIAGVKREGPLVQVTIPGQVLDRLPARLEVRAPMDARAIDRVEVTVLPGVIHQLTAIDTAFVGSFLPPARSNPPPLHICVTDSEEHALCFDHPYRLRQRTAGVVSPIEVPDVTDLFAVVVAPDASAVWFGGATSLVNTAAGRAGTLVYVAQDESPPVTLVPDVQFSAPLPEGTIARIEDLAIDARGRLHAVFLQAQDTVQSVEIVGNGVLVSLDASQVPGPEAICQTVTAFAAAYPLRLQGVASPSPRAVGAAGRSIWLYGSDAGVVRVKDAFLTLPCAPEEEIAVEYLPLVQRQNDNPQDQNDLLTNSVPAFVPGRHGERWFGTALGLTRWQQGQFTPVPFNREVVIRDNVATLEAFFQAVAAAIFEARPLTTAQVGTVSFEEVFDRELVKEDIIFTLLLDTQERLWAGTLGGGLRRIEAVGEGFRDTLQLTRTAVTRIDPRDGARTEALPQGIGSNIIFALAEGPDGSIWAATNEGVSRIQATDGDPITITNFSTLDGLALPVRDVAVTPDGTVWLATAGGMFRIVSQAGAIQGNVIDEDGQPVAGADVTVPGSAVHTVTDTMGNFVLAHLPLGTRQVRIDGARATNGPFPTVVRTVEVREGAQTLPLPLILVPSVLQALEGDQARVAVNMPLRLVALASDASGNPVPGLTVTFQLLDPTQGSLADEEVSTNAEGEATTTLIATVVGTLQVVARTAEPGSEVTFTVQAENNRLILVRVGGNTRRGQAGETLPAPLVVRLENQFGTPVVGAAVTAAILQGEGVFVSAPTTPQSGTVHLAQAQDCPVEMEEAVAVARTNDQGEACFFLRATSEDERENDLEVEVAARDFPDVPPLRFLVIIGEIDTPDIPLDLALNARGDRLFVADRRSGLRTLDISNDNTPEEISAVNLDGTEVRLAYVANATLGDPPERLYVATNFPLRVYIFDPEQPDADAILGRFQFTDPALQRHVMTGIAVQDDYAYVVTDARTANAGTLQVVNIRVPETCQSEVDAAIPLPGRPIGIAISGHFAYIPAGEKGLLIVDVRDPLLPVQASILPGRFFSNITVADGLAYVIETRRDEETQQDDPFFIVLDLSDPDNPQPMGEGIKLPRVTQVAEVATTIVVDQRFAYLNRFALGLQAFDISSRAPVGRIDTPSQALQVALRTTAEGTLLYVSDQIFGVQVIRGPGVETTDTDGDGIIDFFDVFPEDPQESQDTDRDGMGDEADMDDDNDGFSDTEEREAIPSTDPLDPLSFPRQAPPSNITTIFVDAASMLGARERNGTEAAPYRSITEGLMVLQEGRAPQVDTLLIQPGIYSPLTTQERFPLDLSRLARLTLRGNGSNLEPTVIDAGFSGDIFFRDTSATPPPNTSATVVIENLTLRHGAHGVFLREEPEAGTTEIVLRGNQIVENTFAGISMNGNAHDRNTISENMVAENGQEGLGIFEGSVARVTANRIEDNGGVGVFVSFEATAAIVGNPSIAGNGDDGVRIVNGSVATVQANAIRTNGSFDVGSAGGCEPLGNGIFVADATVDITHNLSISGHRLDGILIQENATVTIADNTIHENGLASINFGRGIHVSRSPKDRGEITVRHNRIFDNRRDGLLVENTNAAVTIIDNNISQDLVSNRAFPNGIAITNMIPVVAITGNTISGYNNGISLNQVSARIDNNKIRDNASAGLSLVISGHAEITANYIVDNDGIGVDLTGVAGMGDPIARITGNTIIGNDQGGLLIFQLSEVQIMANTIRDNGGESNLDIAGSGGFAIVQDNTVQASRIGHGMRLACLTADISGGEVSDNAMHGILLGFGSDFQACPEASPTIATIACTGAPLTVARNGGAGIQVDSGSLAQLNQARILFDRNVGGNVSGGGQVAFCPE